MAIREELEEILRTYLDAREQPFPQHEVFGRFATLSELFRSAEPVASRPHLKVVHSAGRGNWAHVPWVSFLDERETTTTQSGVYCVYLFDSEMRGVYLTLNQGVTEVGRSHAKLRERAQSLERFCADLREGFSVGEVPDLGTSSGLGGAYAAGTAALRYYAATGLPTDEALMEDLESLLGAYDSYLASGGATANEGPSPGAKAVAVYVGRQGEENFRFGLENQRWGFPGMSDALRDLAPGDWIIHGLRPTGNGVRVPEERWATETIGRVQVGRVTRAPQIEDSPFWPDEIDEGEVKYPARVQFEPLETLTDLSLSSDGPLGPAAEALRLSALNRGYGHVVPASEVPILSETAPIEATREGARRAADSFQRAVRDSGLSFEGHGDLPLALLAAICTKPFAILTGLSGSGKTQLAQKLGQWFGPTAYRVVPVRPDWTGSEMLFGFEDALRPPLSDDRSPWHVPAALEFMLRAVADPQRPHLLILDEMNLAHVERYFADFLSGIESREQVLPNLQKVDGGYVLKAEPKWIPIPRNLVVIGTVNVDETTYMFSPKVLDRANTFEFRVDSAALDPEATRPSGAAPASVEDLGVILTLAQDDEWHQENSSSDSAEFAERLRRLHAALAVDGYEFGHRVFYEAMRFLAIYEAMGGEADGALDRQVVQKVLPRIHGSRRQVERPLVRIAGFALNPDDPPAIDRADELEPLSEDAALELTFKKAQRMIGRMTATQFTSFTD